MADDVTLPGSGAVIVTDDIGSGRQVQVVKAAFGPDGSATMVSAAAPLPTADTGSVLTGSVSAVGTVIGPFDTSSYANILIWTSGTYSATVQLQGSMDGTTWQNATHSGTVSPSGLGGGAFTSSSSLTSGSQVRVVPGLPFYRLQVTAYTSGTINGSIWLSRFPPSVVVTGESTSSISITGSVTGTNGVTSDAVSGGSYINAGSLGLLFNGTTWDRQRTPTTFKSAATAASGNTAVWTPAASKRFRLLRYKIDVSQDAAQSSGGVITIGLQDNTTDLGLSQSVFVPGTAATTMGSGWTSGWIDLGNGKASAAINQNLHVNLSAALTSGTVRVIACGTEE